MLSRFTDTTPGVMEIMMKCTCSMLGEGSPYCAVSCVCVCVSSLVEEMRKVSCALWREESEVHLPDSLFSVVWRLVPRFRYWSSYMKTLYLVQ